MNWETKTNLSKSDFNALKGAVIAAVKSSEPFWFPDEPRGLLKKVGIVYYFKPATKSPGEMAVVHP